MNYQVAVLLKNELMDYGIDVIADNPADACQQVFEMSQPYITNWESHLILARTTSNIRQWLLSMVGLQVTLCKNMMTYEGILRWNAGGLFEVRFHEFTPSEISSFGYDKNDVAYIVLTGDNQ